MRPTSESPSSYLNQASLRSRTVSFLLALAIAILVILMLLRLGLISVAPPEPKPLPVIVEMQKSGSEAAPQKTKAAKAKSAHSATKIKVVDKPHTAPKTPPTPKPPIPWNVIPLSSEEMADSDIASKPQRSTQTASADTGGDAGATGKGNGSTYGPGEGPGGEQMYNVDWYRRPTDAELSFYMPKNGAGPGYGEVACKMIANYHVEDCHELGETPGTGYARTLRQAAWQFLVRPPRVGDRPMLGTWVRIHFDFTERKAS